MDEIVTTDWSKFGNREIEEAKELLSHIKEIPDAYGKVEVHFNTHSGYVFLSDEDYRVWMMTDDGNLEEFFSCPECGEEGFKEDFDKGSDCEGCREIANRDE